MTGNLNEDGYFLNSLDELCQITGCTLEEAETALRTVQSLDPLGVAARDLRECLSMQLEALEMRDTLAWRIVQEHLPSLENHKFKEIASRTGSDFDAVLGAVDTIKHLIPKPGQKYNPQNVNYIQPEVTIARVDEEFVIIQNDEGMPHLRLNSSYKELLKNNGVSGETKSFVREKF